MSVLITLYCLHMLCISASPLRDASLSRKGSAEGSIITSALMLEMCQDCTQCMTKSAYFAGVPRCHAWSKEYCVGLSTDYVWCGEGSFDEELVQQVTTTSVGAPEFTASFTPTTTGMVEVPEYSEDPTVFSNTTAGSYMCSELPTKVVGMYVLLADDNDLVYTTTYDWQPHLHEYQRQGANVFYFTFIEPVSMEVPQSFINLAATRGSGKPGSVPTEAKIIFAIGGQAYSMNREWPWLTSSKRAEAMAYQVSEWIVNGWCDGVDLDIETGPQANNETAIAAMVSFVAKLKMLVPNSIITQPAFGTANAAEINDVVIEQAFRASKRLTPLSMSSGTESLYGALDAVGIMVYESTESLRYMDNYEKGCDILKCSKWWCPLDACVPRNRLVAGLKGTASIKDINIMKDETVNNRNGYRGVMVWYASVIDKSTSSAALQYDISWDASTADENTKAVWRSLLRSAEISERTNCTPSLSDNTRARRQIPSAIELPVDSEVSLNHSRGQVKAQDQKIAPSAKIANNYQGVYIKTWEGGWTGEGIRGQYSQLYGVADIVFLTFFRPIPDGLECDETVSMCASVWETAVGLYGEEVSATEVYRNASIAAKNATGMQTLLSMGGWTYREDFAFLSTFTTEQIHRWALEIRQMVDVFGADGIDLDYEAESSQQWEDEIVKTNVVGILREVMPSSEGYTIMMTIPGLAGVQGPAQAISDFFNPPLTLSYETGKAVSTIIQNHEDIDMLQLMTYDGEPNLNPMYCMDLTRQTLQRLLSKNLQHKLALGVELGPQEGNCKLQTEGWCTHDIERVVRLADFARRNDYGGIFYWANLPILEAKEFYNATYPFFKA